MKQDEELPINKYFSIYQLIEQIFTGMKSIGFQQAEGQGSQLRGSLPRTFRYWCRIVNEKTSASKVNSLKVCSYYSIVDIAAGACQIADDLQPQYEHMALVSKVSFAPQEAIIYIMALKQFHSNHFFQKLDLPECGIDASKKPARKRPKGPILKTQLRRYPTRCLVNCVR